jgi:hypothetical protein
MRSTLLGLCLLAVVGLSAWRYLAPSPAPKSPIERLKSASPVETVRQARPTPPSARPTAEEAPKVSALRAQMEERFNDLKKKDVASARP